MNYSLMTESISVVVVAKEVKKLLREVGSSSDT